ncbi:major facilitator superfamily-domain-containing protein [Flagelloscypha sp. PMI_526]|nr:major facilitator superfamily-domain-containing protein [Flagelloscypha sp. PMI_526]
MDQSVQEVNLAVHSTEHNPDDQAFQPQGRAAFWLAYMSLIICTFLAALEQTAIGTILQTIAKSFDNADSYSWIGISYVLANTAFLPLSGNLADIFGRRPTMLLSLGLFAFGSGLSGAAQSMRWLIAARAIQGLGGGGILNLSEIVVADLVPLADRGGFIGLITFTWAFAGVIGPIIGGALAEHVSWRWVFYINLPITGLATVIVIFFLRVRTPPGRMRDKLASVDWLGNAIVIAGITLATLGVSWAGARYAWSDVHVLALLLSGLALIVSFVIYERYVPKIPTLPWVVISNRTSLGGYVATFIHGVVYMAVAYYLPSYFQACLSLSPLQAGLHLLPTACVIAPFSYLHGVAIKFIHRYLPGNYVGWGLVIVGFGLLSLLKASSNTAEWVAFQAVAASGIGTLYSASVFPILAPTPVQHSGPALALFSFLRLFASVSPLCFSRLFFIIQKRVQTWGITIASTILQNQLKRHLPTEILSILPSSNPSEAFALIDKIPNLPEPLRQQVKDAFAMSFSTIWLTMTGIAGIGFLSTLVMKEIHMHEVVDENYGLEEMKPRGEVRVPASAQGPREAGEEV